MFLCDRPVKPTIVVMGFSAELWKSIELIYDAILRHPFIRGLGDGSLDHEAFKFYVLQDALYLREFGRALSLAAPRAPQDDWIVMFSEHAANAAGSNGRFMRVSFGTGD